MQHSPQRIVSYKNIGDSLIYGMSNSFEELHITTNSSITSISVGFSGVFHSVNAVSKYFTCRQGNYSEVHLWLKAA